VAEILFVDDESEVLARLRHALHLHREHWTVGRAQDAAAALEYLANHRVDVLVADVAMPGLDGPALVEQSRVRFPDTARVVLSDRGDRDPILCTAASAQQFLEKPCDPAALIATVDSILAARALMQDSHLRALLGGIDNLPKPPAIYAELAALVNRADSTVTEVAQLVERDLATTAELLKLVNSSFFGLATEVTSVSRAVTLLGLDVIQALVLAGQAFRPSAPLPSGIVPAELAAQGVRACLAVRRTRSAAGLTTQTVGQLSVAALLYDVGLLALAASKPASWAVYTNHKALLPPREAQLCAFGCTIGRASAYLLGLWGFHSTIVNALAEQPIGLDDDVARLNASRAALAIAEAHEAAAAVEALEGS
jgi:HD-like signal output (HDOD) protein